MNIAARSLAKKISIIVAVVVPLFIILMATTGLSGLASINPENQGKVLVYAVSDQQAETIKTVSVNVMIPLAVITGLLAAANIRLAKQPINVLVLLLCVFFVCWFIFASWALTEKYV